MVLLSNREETEPCLLTLRIMAALLGLPLPRPTERLLPEGLFAEDTGPAWIEHRDGAVTFLGAREALFAGDVPGEAVSLSPYLPVRLQRAGEEIVGEIGHAARRFRPVPPDARLPDGLAGTWRAAAQHAELTIEIAADGSGTASLGAGPLHRRVPLTPLGGGRALMPIGAAPWSGRACVWLHAPDMLRLVTNRSRVLDFHRM